MKSISTITLTESDYIIPNSFYADTDGDGVDDYLEDLNADGNLDNDDTDADGIANYLDVDDDNDSIPTFREHLLGDTDNDGTPNYLDTDDDNDQWLTAAEGQEDDDNDGVPNHLDNTHYANPVNGPLTYQNYENYIGDKAYELSNHLGNVLSVISDKKILAFGTQIVQVHEGITGFEADGNEVSLAIVDNGNTLQCATSFNDTGTFFKQTLQANKEYIISVDINKDTYDADIKVVVEDDATGNIYHTNTITQSGYNFFTFTAPETATYKTRYLKQHQNVGDESIQAFYIEKFFIFTLSATETVDGFLADVLSYNDYYPYGMLLPERHASDESYRYGFQGQEKDDELKGEGNSLNYTFRMHDPRIGRFFAIDPLAPKYPYYTPYQFSGNKVIAQFEIEGLESGWAIEGDKIVYKTGPFTGLYHTEEAANIALYIGTEKHRIPVPEGHPTFKQETRTHEERKRQEYQINSAIQGQKWSAQIFSNPNLQIAHGVYIGVPEGLIEVSGMMVIDKVADAYKYYKYSNRAKLAAKVANKMDNVIHPEFAGLADDAFDLYKAAQVKALSNINNSGTTVLGHASGVAEDYISLAKNKGASFFDLGHLWGQLLKNGQDPWKLNVKFLDKIAKNGDDIILNVTKENIRRGSYLEREVKYLIDNKGYIWDGANKLVKKVIKIEG